MNPHAPLRRLAWLISTSILIIRIGAANVTFQNTNPNLVYVPALCSILSVDDNFPEECDGQWYVKRCASCARKQFLINIFLATSELQVNPRIARVLKWDRNSNYRSKRNVW